MKVVTVNGIARTEFNKKANKKLRKENLVPAVIYGGEKPIHFAATVNELRTLIYTPDFKIAEVSLDGKAYSCILKETQFHPVTDSLIHLDFIELVPGKSIKVEIPIRFRGTSPGVKTGGKLIKNLHKAKVKTIPENLIDELSLDVSTVELGQSIRVRDIDAIEGVEILNSPGIPVASVEIPRALRSAADAAAKEEGVEEAVEE